MVCRYPDENLIKDLCRIGNVSRSGYYAWLKAAPLRAKRIEQDARDFNLILAAVNYRGYEKGNRTIYMTLARMGHKMGRNKIRRLCRFADCAVFMAISALSAKPIPIEEWQRP